MQICLTVIPTRRSRRHAASHHDQCRYLLGGRPLGPDDADLRWIGALCYRNGQLEQTGLADGVLDHPATGVAWLANFPGVIRHAALHD